MNLIKTQQAGEAAAFVRSDDPALFPPLEYDAQTLPKDTTTGKGAPDLELFITPVAYRDHGHGIPPNFGHYNFMLHAVTLRHVQRSESFSRILIYSYYL